MSRKPGESPPPWTPEEEAALRQLAGRVPAAEIARRLGRSVSAVRAHAKVMGLLLRVRRA